MHLDTPFEQVVDGLADAHVRLDPAHDRLRAPAQVEPVRTRGAKYRLLDRALAFEPDLRRGMPETFRILLTDHARDIEDARRLHQLATGLGDALKRRIRAEPLLDVHDDK